MSAAVVCSDESGAGTLLPQTPAASGPADDPNGTEHRPSVQLTKTVTIYDLKQIMVCHQQKHKNTYTSCELV